MDWISKMFSFVFPLRDSVLVCALFNMYIYYVKFLMERQHSTSCESFTLKMSSREYYSHSCRKAWWICWILEGRHDHIIVISVPVSSRVKRNIRSSPDISSSLDIPSCLLTASFVTVWWAGNRVAFMHSRDIWTWLFSTMTDEVFFHLVLIRLMCTLWLANTSLHKLYYWPQFRCKTIHPCVSPLPAVCM